MPKNFRRVVTGHRVEDGKSVIWMDGPAPNVAESFTAMGSGDAHDSEAENAMMHETQTTDYAIVIEGEIWAVMEAGETKLEAGDVLVQRGTNHAWSNRSDKIAVVAFVLVGASPIK